MLAKGCSRRFLVPVFLFTCIVLFIISSPGQIRDLAHNLEDDGEIRLDSWSAELQQQKHLRTHIAVASLFPAHFDVYLAAANTFRDVLGGQDAAVDVFAGERPFRFKFQEIIDRVDLFSGEVRDAAELLHAMNDTHFYPAEPGAVIDLLVLGTCEIECVAL